MRVFGELNFCILIITCSTLFVNKQVQALDRQDTNSKVQDQGVVTESKTNEHGIKTSKSNQSVKKVVVPKKKRLMIKRKQVREVTTNEEAEEFFDCLVRPRPPRITKIEFVQKLDHFDHFDDRMWIQRAYLDSQYERDEGPVLLQLGSLQKIFPHEVEDPTMVVLAKRYHAPMYILEHRYHGESVPTDFSGDNLELYLRIEQVLADIEFFIKKSKRATRKWIIFGKGYGGTLAAWYRLKYPHAVSGALTSISAMISITEVQEIYGHLTNYEENEKTILHDAFNEIREAIKRNEYEALKDKFNMCTQLDEGTNKDDNAKFMYWSIITYLVDTIITDNWKVQFWLTSDPEKSPLDRLASAVQQFNGKKCFSVDFHDSIQKYNNLNIKYKNDIDYPISLQLGLGTRPHFFQRCTEYGLFETSNDGKITFGVKIHLDYYLQLCEQAFGRKFDSNIYREAIDTTNMIYGGHGIAATNLIYVTPRVKFWSSLGIAKSKFNEIVVVNNEDKNGEDYLKVQYDLIIDKLNKWTRKKSEGVDYSVVGTTVTVGETVVSQSAAVEEDAKTAT